MKNQYKLFFIKENNKIKHINAYDSFCEFILTDDHSVLDVMNNSYTISEDIYRKIEKIKKEFDLKSLSIREFNDLLHHEEIMI